MNGILPGENGNEGWVINSNMWSVLYFFMCRMQVFIYFIGEWDKALSFAGKFFLLPSLYMLFYFHIRSFFS